MHVFGFSGSLWLGISSRTFRCPVWFLPPITGAVGFASIWSRGRFPLVKSAQTVGSAKRLEPGGPCGRKIAQLMLIMLSCRLVKSAQSLQGFAKRLNPRARGGHEPGNNPADAHDALLSPHKNCAITGAGGGFCKHRGLAGKLSCLAKSAEPLARWILQASGVQDPCGRKPSWCSRCPPPAWSNLRNHWGGGFWMVIDVLACQCPVHSI